MTLIPNNARSVILQARALRSEKACSTCKQVKPLADFNRSRENPDGLRYYCRSCQSVRAASYRERNKEKVQQKGRDWYNNNKKRVKQNCRKWRLHLNYGMTVEEYEQRLANQGGVCAICFGKETIKGRSLAVDHCHATGKIRGILCGRCNKSIGAFEDSAVLLSAAISYLKSHGAQS